MHWWVAPAAQSRAAEVEPHPCRSKEWGCGNESRSGWPAGDRRPDRSGDPRNASRCPDVRHRHRYRRRLRIAVTTSARSWALNVVQDRRPCIDQTVFADVTVARRCIVGDRQVETDHPGGDQGPPLQRDGSTSDPARLPIQSGPGRLAKAATTRSDRRHVAGKTTRGADQGPRSRP